MAPSKSPAMPQPQPNGSASSSSSSAPWRLDSWRTKPIKQCPEYPDSKALGKYVEELKALPPLVHQGEIVRLKAELRKVAEGRAFLLQGGDCAELFDYCRPGAIESKIKLLLQMSLVMIQGSDKPVVRIGRMAGQYAKPRSSPTERVDGKEVPSFRGDILNGFPLDERELDPSRLLRAYHYSAATLNYMRSAISSGIADLHQPLDWDLGHVRDPQLRAKYKAAVRSLTDNLRFMSTIGATTGSHELQTVDFFTSHEGLVLEYEQALTRKLENPEVASKRGHRAAAAQMEYYNTSAHFLWIGDRTRQIDGAHVEFFRGIANPIGVKVGPSTPAEDLLALLRALNPSREKGKITLITRYGHQKVADLLPAHIRAVEGSEYRGCVVWQCDPMHGNTLPEGAYKTRHFAHIFSELSQTLRIHRDEGSYLGGLHLELTGEAVTECLGGAGELASADLPTNYTTFCDPRLNEKQALEIAFLVADHFHQERESSPPSTPGAD